MDTGAECTLLHGNPKKFLGPEVSIDGYEGQSVRAKAMRLSLGIGHIPHHEHIIYVSRIPDYILGIDILQCLWLHMTAGEFCLQV